MALQDVIRWLLPREDHFYGYLRQQASVAHEAARALEDFREKGSVDAVRLRVQALEHKGDELFHGLEEALARTFVTPIDREDLQKLSSELDDVTDMINGAIRAAFLYGVEESSEPMRALAHVVARCTELIDKAMPLLEQHKYAELITLVRDIRKIEKEGDTIFREAMSHLFKSDAVDAKRLLREREVLEGLENAIDHCDRLAGTLANLAVKHG